VNGTHELFVFKDINMLGEI